jgi:hypothetical protein
MYADGVCALPGSQQEGGACNVWDTKNLQGPCAEGLDCLNSVCTSVMGNSCSSTYQCGSISEIGNTNCLCNTTSRTSTCQEGDGQSFKPLMDSANECLQQVSGVNVLVSLLCELSFVLVWTASL